MKDMRATTATDGTPPCPYVSCNGTVTVEAEGTWGDRPAIYGTCSKCGRPVEVIDGVEQLTLDGGTA